MTSWLLCVARLAVCLAACALGALCVYGCYREMAREIQEATKAL